MRKSISSLLTVSLFVVFLIGCGNPIGNTTKSSNSDLSALIVSTGTLSPAFDAGITAYSVNVPNATTSITITGTKAESNAALSANNGVAQNLNVGTNTITITVTAQDGTTTKDYVVTVCRASTVQCLITINFNYTGESIVDQLHQAIINIDQYSYGKIIKTVYLTNNTAQAFFIVDKSYSIIYIDMSIDKDSSGWHSTGDPFNFHGGTTPIGIDISSSDTLTINVSLDDSRLFK